MSSAQQQPENAGGGGLGALAARTTSGRRKEREHREVPKPIDKPKPQGEFKPAVPPVVKEAGGQDTSVGDKPDVTKPPADDVVETQGQHTGGQPQDGRQDDEVDGGRVDDTAETGRTERVEPPVKDKPKPQSTQRRAPDPGGRGTSEPATTRTSSAELLRRREERRGGRAQRQREAAAIGPVSVSAGTIAKLIAEISDRQPDAAATVPEALDKGASITAIVDAVRFAADRHLLEGEQINMLLEAMGLGDHATR